MPSSPCRIPTRARATTARAACVAAFCLLGAIFAAGCSSAPERDGHAASLEAQERFWESIESLCGQAFEGRVVEDSTQSPDFEGAQLVMHVRRCEPDRILIPFHVGEDRSRTWVLTRTASGLRLKHDHRKPDGAEDEITQYGGDTQGRGTATRQEFHADAHTAALIPAAATNVWTIEISPGRTYAYALRREGTDRRFRVEFDLTAPIPPPPAPWGH